jgi:hypothetical protein
MWLDSNTTRGDSIPSNMLASLWSTLLSIYLLSSPLRQRGMSAIGHLTGQLFSSHINKNTLIYPTYKCCGCPAYAVRTRYFRVTHHAYPAYPLNI